MADNKEISQALADQNIFDLMGDQGGTIEQKEQFLNELQKVIWDDFLDNDVELLLTEEEIRPLEGIITQEGATDIAKQDQIVEYLDDKIPDLEDIMLEKALKLKEDMVMERILSLEEVYADNEENTKKLQEIREMIKDERWGDAAGVLNTIH